MAGDSKEAVERMAGELASEAEAMHRDWQRVHAQGGGKLAKAKLDAFRRQRLIADMLIRLLAQRDAADRAGFERGVREAAAVCAARHQGMKQIREYAEAQWCAAEILALLKDRPDV